MLKARELHAQAEIAREKDQDLVRSLQLADEAMVAYVEDKDWGGVAEVLCTRVNTLKHLYQKSGNPAYLVLGEHEATAAIEIAERSGSNGDQALPYLYLAKISEELGKFDSAADAYERSVSLMEEFKPEGHYRPAVVLDMKNHWYTCAYRADGDEKWIGMAEEALHELKNIEDEEKYNKDVWVSGGYMRLARILKDVHREKAKEYLEKAKEVIDGNSELVLRREQWEKLEEAFM